MSHLPQKDGLTIKREKVCIEKNILKVKSTTRMQGDAGWKQAAHCGAAGLQRGLGGLLWTGRGGQARRTFLYHTYFPIVRDYF